MELHLDPIIPITRVINGRNSFNRGYHHPLRGKTFEEYFGKEKADRIKRKMSIKQMGHPGHSSLLANAKAVIAIYDGKIIARFPSARDAAKQVGISTTGMYRWLHKACKPKNGWQWFYENESYKWCDLIKQ